MKIDITDFNVICCADYSTYHFVKETHYHQSTAMITFALGLLGTKHQNIALGKMCEYYPVSELYIVFHPAPIG